MNPWHCSLRMKELNLPFPCHPYVVSTVHRSTAQTQRELLILLPSYWSRMKRSDIAIIKAPDGIFFFEIFFSTTLKKHNLGLIINLNGVQRGCCGFLDCVSTGPESLDSRLPHHPCARALTGIVGILGQQMVYAQLFQAWNKIPAPVSRTLNITMIGLIIFIF